MNIPRHIFEIEMFLDFCQPRIVCILQILVKLDLLDFDSMLEDYPDVYIRDSLQEVYNPHYKISRSD